MTVQITIDDRVLRDLEKKIADLTAHTVRVGVLSNKGGSSKAVGRDGKATISLTELAAIHEFGSPAAGIPERSFIRSAFPANDAELERVAGVLAHNVIMGRNSVAKALGLLGIWASARVKSNVMSGAHIKPKNADATIAKKGSSRPLVDTGRLVNSVNHLVVRS